ncbi:glycosyl transferase [Hydrococcus rivularis NIES-593]|uniref:Beta-monoglucosyldiacylglycerol synthase n=1 Tax=Hydrococcus rivularis NIES-593 TaxID=1921803 RepID=A0A1U7HI59_9CYAN|nr:glycosyltransferase family 2 protein [Hydrococcus rivularis]OKH23244.1 glycosyl transferase [Hydrococcus rivularis NIES-593]
MPEKYWSENESEQELDPIGSLLSEWVDPEDEEEEFRSDFFKGLSGRRKKAAFVLMAVWSTTIALHLVTWGTWVIMGMTGLMVIHGLRLVSAKAEPTPDSLSDEALANAPSVSLLVAAKNEESVIGNLVTMLCNLDYPTDKYEVWVIDDHSSDKTPQILEKLARQYPQLRVVRRPAGAGGGKSGALNQVLPQTRGEIIGVFDADAKVTPDLLRRVLPIFEAQEIGAVQVRKAIANSAVNFWTRGQMTEMALDSYYQQQRIAVGGIGELRGNGQFARRSALQRCGGWNEQTITDDLDLTIRLHLDDWKIGFLLDPAVEEEGVTSAIALWHQRNRWAEGGYQRYLDYWRLILSQRMGFKKKLDLLYFALTQYILPTAAVPDFVMAIARHRLPMLSPLTGFTISLAFWGMLVGLRRTRSEEKLSFFNLPTITWQTLRGTIYMLHWLAIIPSITARMSVRPKRLKWVKTVHEGTSEESFEF